MLIEFFFSFYSPVHGHDPGLGDHWAKVTDLMDFLKHDSWESYTLSAQQKTSTNLFISGMILPKPKPTQKRTFNTLNGK